MWPRAREDGHGASLLIQLYETGAQVLAHRDLANGEPATGASSVLTF